MSECIERKESRRGKAWGKVMKKKKNWCLKVLSLRKAMTYTN